LSGVAQTLQPPQALWYERQFNLAAPGNGAHVLLHFEAVDYITTVIVNGKTVGEHQGGYDPFTVDITDALTTAGTQDLIVKVIDTTGQGNYPINQEGNRASLRAASFILVRAGFGRLSGLRPFRRATSRIY
jgi:hypothetical protein